MNSFPSHTHGGQEISWRKNGGGGRISINGESKNRINLKQGKERIKMIALMR